MSVVAIGVENATEGSRGYFFFPEKARRRAGKECWIGHGGRSFGATSFPADATHAMLSFPPEEVTTTTLSLAAALVFKFVALFWTVQPRRRLAILRSVSSSAF